MISCANTHVLSVPLGAAVHPSLLLLPHRPISPRVSRGVEVLYGADIQTSDTGSGFPSADTARSDAERRVASHPFNVCNMPFQEGSCLRHVERTTGISVPWLYFGMCLSAFCWHVEDHHLYSVNFHHFGDPKARLAPSGCGEGALGWGNGCSWRWQPLHKACSHSRSALWSQPKGATCAALTASLLPAFPASLPRVSALSLSAPGVVLHPRCRERPLRGGYAAEAPAPLRGAARFAA